MKLKVVIPAGLGALGIGFLAGKSISEKNFRKEVKELFKSAKPDSDKRFSFKQLQGLPEPVQKYFQLVLKEGQPFISYARLKHNGQFKTDLKKEWMDISGEQYFTTSAPGFIWRGKTTFFTATDKFLNGQGSLTIKLLSSIKIIDAKGEKYNQGELLRWLGESAWLPTNLLPSENLKWAPLDDETAGLTYKFNNQELKFKVRFKPTGEIISFETRRFMGETNLEHWIGKFSHYQQMNGILVPTFAEGAWILNGQEHPYARFNVLKLEYNKPELF